MDILLTWKKQHEAYMAEVEVAKVVRKKSLKSFSKLIIEEVAGKFQGFSPVIPELIDSVIQVCKTHKRNLPTRSQMEMYIINIRAHLGDHIAVREFYMKNFLNN